MIVHEIFAQVHNGVVQNIFVCDNYPTADHLTKCIYGSEAFAVDCLQYKCSVGDKYHDGCFWRVAPETGEEVQIPYIPTQEQQVAALTEENAELNSTINTLLGVE